MSDKPNDKKPRKPRAAANKADSEISKPAPATSTLSFDTSTVDVEKRKFITIATACVGAAGALGIMVPPLVGSMAPSERAKAAGAPVEVDISKLEPGTFTTVEWRGKPVWVIHRTDEQTAELAKLNGELSDPESDVSSQQPAYCKNASRGIKPNISVVVGICTHLGCSPTSKLQKGGDMGEAWKGGFFCPCHGSKFDLAGRVFKGSPAPTNLVVPPHQYLTDNTILIGVDKAEA
ncbi:MAG TPA: ubiquinol-cytochrome c reductase iron-sulfur subunit [Methylophilus sp.]|nr:ubiquinol-cytochrome c reductase iron-sulfur subunit [Methylophilus sp.]HQQ34209.1 ubiquinol-cytochrome c reductase iron-sulfur subunit [Methylophilus sp.]